MDKSVLWLSLLVTVYVHVLMKYNIFRYYDDFKINITSGISNLTQLYIKVRSSILDKSDSQELANESNNNYHYNCNCFPVIHPVLNAAI